MLSGGMHYPRVPQEDWARVMALAKEMVRTSIVSLSLGTQELESYPCPSPSIGHLTAEHTRALYASLY
jgi:hypothetical protein